MTSIIQMWPSCPLGKRVRDLSLGSSSQDGSVGANDGSALNVISTFLQ